MFRHLSIWLVLVLLMAPARANAQTKWDLTGIAGVFAGHSPEADVPHYQQDWYRTGEGGIILGHYVTENLKVELQASRTGEGRQFIQRYVAIPGVAFPYPIGAEARTSTTSVATVATWQFFENQWVHPFVQAGVATEFERRVVNTWAQRYYSGDPRQGGTAISIAEERVEGPETITAARAVIGGGAKLYVSPRLFVRTEGRASIGHRRQHVAFRVGFGVDF